MAELVVSNGSESVSCELQARDVPPPPGAFGTLVGYLGAALIEIRFRMLTEHGRARAEFQVFGSFGSNGGETG